MLCSIIKYNILLCMIFRRLKRYCLVLDSWSGLAHRRGWLLLSERVSVCIWECVCVCMAMCACVSECVAVCASVCVRVLPDCCLPPSAGLAIPTIHAMPAAETNITLMNTMHTDTHTKTHICARTPTGKHMHTLTHTHRKTHKHTAANTRTHTQSHICVCTHTAL